MIREFNRRSKKVKERINKYKTERKSTIIVIKNKSRAKQDMIKRIRKNIRPSKDLKRRQ